MRKHEKTKSNRISVESSDYCSTVHLYEIATVSEINRFKHLYNFTTLAFSSNTHSARVVFFWYDKTLLSSDPEYLMAVQNSLRGNKMWGPQAGPLLFVTQKAHRRVVSPVPLSVWVCFRGTHSFRRGCCLTGNCKWVCVWGCAVICMVPAVWVRLWLNWLNWDPVMLVTCMGLVIAGLLREPRWDVSLGRHGVVKNWRVSST